MTSGITVIISVIIAVTAVFFMAPVATVEDAVPEVKVEWVQPDVPETVGVDFFMAPAVTVEDAVPEMKVEWVLPDVPETVEADTVPETEKGVAGTWLFEVNGYMIEFREDGTCGNDHGFDGTYTVEGDVLTIVRDTGYTEQYAFTVEGDVMNLRDLNDDSTLTLNRQ